MLSNHKNGQKKYAMYYAHYSVLIKCIHNGEP